MPEPETVLCLSVQPVNITLGAQRAGSACTKDAALLELLNHILNYVETQVLCTNRRCPQNCTCVPEITNSVELLRRVSYSIIRKRGCPNGVGWMARIHNEAVAVVECACDCTSSGSGGSAPGGTGSSGCLSLPEDTARRVRESGTHYTGTQRVTEGSIIKRGFDGGAAVVPDGTSQPLGELIPEVNCCFDECLMEIIYGIESTFGRDRNTNGPRGKTGPNGPFQLDKTTATENGLTVNETVDERLDLEKAARAASSKVHKLARILTWNRLTSLGINEDCGGNLGCRCCTEDGTNSLNSECCDNIRKLILLGYNAGDGVLGWAKCLAKRAGKNPCIFADVLEQIEQALKNADPTRYDENSGTPTDAQKVTRRQNLRNKITETTQYVEKYTVLKSIVCPRY